MSGSCRHHDWLIDPPRTDNDLAALEHEALREHHSASVSAYLDEMLHARADAGCYGCLGTGRFQWAGIRPDPCSCALHSRDCEPGMCAPDCLYRREAEGLTEETAPWRAVRA